LMDLTCPRARNRHSNDTAKMSKRPFRKSISP
jgi:hypothetical protein